MLLSGIQKFTLLDYPEKLACMVFTPGCNFRCGYCHNPEFVLPEMIQEIKNSFIPEEVFFKFLKKRQGKLEGVVITGGEPTIMGDLIPFMRRVKDLGFALKLDTNGNKPEVLQQAIDENLVDYIAMDVKTSLGEYKKLVGERAFEIKLAQSIDKIKKSNVSSEFRSTLIKEIHTDEILKAMQDILKGTKKLYLQNFRPATTLNPLFQSFHPFSEEKMKDIKRAFESVVESVEIRA